MKSGGRSLSADRTRFGLRRILVVVQVALSLLLLTGALLFGRSLRNLTTIDAGLNEDGLLIVNLDATRANVAPERRVALYERLIARMRATPGVEAAATAGIVQLSGSSWDPSVEMIGMPPLKDPPRTWCNRVSSGYFATM
jgi:hypothetical protein